MFFFDAVLGFEGGDVEFFDVAEAFFEGEKLRVVVDDLEEVEVGADEDCFDSLLVCLLGERAHYIISLIIVAFVKWPTKGF